MPNGLSLNHEKDKYEKQANRPYKCAHGKHIIGRIINRTPAVFKDCGTEHIIAVFGNCADNEQNKNSDRDQKAKSNQF